MGVQPYPEQYVDYLVHFHASRDYFECHELLEEYWKEHPGDPFADIWVGLIQIAVGLYHLRRDNRAGAVKMWRSALDKQLAAADTSRLGLDDAELKRMLRERLEQVEALQPDDAAPEFRDMTLPIADPALEAACVARASEWGCKWLAPSAMDNEELIHRHTRRDRSDVVTARAEQLRRRVEAKAPELPYTICFIRDGDRVLLLNRLSRPWMGCWNGVGGKLEPGETPADNIVREIREETGLQLSSEDVVWKGIVTWIVDGRDAGGMHTYIAELPRGTNLATPVAVEEGILDWKPLSWIVDPANQGIASNVRHFLPSLFEGPEVWDYACLFEQGYLVSVERKPLPLRPSDSA